MNGAGQSTIDSSGIDSSGPGACGPGASGADRGGEGLAVVVVAAGRSARMGGTDKTFAELQGAPLIAHTLRRLAAVEVVERIVLVVAGEAVAAGEAVVREYGIGKVTAVCAGGRRRQDSVYNGLRALGECRWVAVHDGARPGVDGEILARAREAVRQWGAATAAVPVKDTIKVVGEGGLIEHTPERARLWAAQTPQAFEYRRLLEAFDYGREREAAAPGSTTDYTDDAAMMEAAGHPVGVFWGSYENLKVTTPEDLIVMSRILGAQAGLKAG